MSNRIPLFGISIDAMTMKEAVQFILESDSHLHPRCRYVVTPNVDHSVMLSKNVALQSAYKDAELVLADGWPVVLASRLLGKALPERVTGADLIPALFEETCQRQSELRAYLLGAGPGVAERAQENIQKKWPNVNVVGTYSPPFGFENDENETESILARIRDAQPDLLVVGFGAPKQELWVHQHCQEISAKWAFCVGACIDFLAEEKKRAPTWVQRLGLEWLFRLSTEPRRLFKRYAYDAFWFPYLVLKEWTNPTPVSREESLVEH